MTFEELQIIGAFLAGRLMKKQREMGGKIPQNSEERMKVMRDTQADLILWLRDHKPEMLPKEAKEICKGIKSKPN